MPPHSKRTLAEVADHEESGDDDYTETGPSLGPSRSRNRAKKTTSRSKPARKRQRKIYSDDDDVMDDDDGSVLSELVDSDSPKEEEDTVEVNDHGRPVRNAAKNAKTYVESGSENGDSDEQVIESENEIPPPKTRKLIVKLKTTVPDTSPVPAVRSRRKRSSSHGIQEPSTPTEAPSSRRTRRSSRISHDEEETLIGLSNSGKHAEVTRRGSREPEVPARSSRAMKSIKYPSKSTIDEVSQENSNALMADEMLNDKASQQEIAESDPQTQDNPSEEIARLVSDLSHAARDSDMEEGIPESQDAAEEVIANQDDDVDDDDDDDPIANVRTSRSSRPKVHTPPQAPVEPLGRLRSRTQQAANSQRKADDGTSDFEPDADQEKEDDMSASEQSDKSPPKARIEYESSNSRSQRARRSKRTASRPSPSSEEDDIEDELAELKTSSRTRKRKPKQNIVYEPRRTRGPRGNVDYRLLRPELNLPVEEVEEDPTATPSKRRGAAGGAGGGGWSRSLFSTYGPFGGAGGPAPLLGGPGGIGATGGVDSDSSDDEGKQRPKPVGGAVGMTPTSGFGPGFGLFPPAAALNADSAQANAGTPANFGKVKDKQALADADPLGVDQHVTFDGVGGLQGHIDQLKEMVALPLLYPEIFLRFKITPPRGVLFHGPPGTGKTLLARALASSVSSQGRKVTFYMRKGADALSKWVGEAEKQLRMLFEEARRTQPSIIFFDEIDGLAPVRSSKQEQIHASIVSTLLALMDGMDGRGQVVVIGATNRPDSVDPALRRPGRFDREFYFPLPNVEARRAILNIHTKGWDPPLEPVIKDELAHLTKGYGGADLRALCTEAALNAVQRRYPQIYKSKEKLLIDPKTIEVLPKDFMISIKKMVPSSERSAASGASALPPGIEPLLRQPLALLERILGEIMPPKSRLTALEEAQYEDAADSGFGFAKVQQAFEQSRVFRPRLLLRGPSGMGQQYLSSALLNHFEGLHVQSFELSVLYGDATSSPEATMIRLFTEVKTHKPAVIYIPNVQNWYMSLGQQLISTFLGLLRSLHPTDPIMVLGVLDLDKDEEPNADFLKQLFGHSKRNQFMLKWPEQPARREFFMPLMNYVAMRPSEFPDPATRKKRILEELAVAPPEPAKAVAPTKEALKAEKKRDRHTLNMLKIQLQPIMDQIRTKYRKFRIGVIEEHQIRYLYDEADPGTVSSDIPTELLARASFRPYEVSKDSHGEPGLLEAASGKFFYNLDTVTIEKRLSNGYYKRPKDFLADIKRLAKDAKAVEDQERLLKANELLTNVEVDIAGIEIGQPVLASECERVYQRELVREKEANEKARKAAEEAGIMPPPPRVSNVPPGGASEQSSLNPSTGPITLGEPVVDKLKLLQTFMPITPPRPASDSVTTNGNVSEANGTSDHRDVEGQGNDLEGDTHMTNSDPQTNSNEHSNERGTSKTHTTTNSSFGPSAQPRPLHTWTAPSQQLRQASGMSAPLSQKSTVTPMAPGSQAADYHNSASTTQTSSGNKNSGGAGDKIGGSQDTGPNLYMYDYLQAPNDGSEIRDTQSDTQPSQHRFASGYSVPSSQYSQSPSLHNLDGSARPRSTSIHALLNDDSSQDNSGLRQPLTLSGEAQTAAPTEKSLGSNLQLDHAYVTRLHDDVSSRTTGCSVEQLENVNSVLMDTVWRMRTEWNRSLVAVTVGEAFNKVLEDMEECGWEFGLSSWGRKP